MLVLVVTLAVVIVVVVGKVVVEAPSLSDKGLLPMIRWCSGLLELSLGLKEAGGSAIRHPRSLEFKIRSAARLACFIFLEIV